MPEEHHEQESGHEIELFTRQVLEHDNPSVVGVFAPGPRGVWDVLALLLFLGVLGAGVWVLLSGMPVLVSKGGVTLREYLQQNEYVPQEREPVSNIVAEGVEKQAMRTNEYASLPFSVRQDGRWLYFTWSPDGPAVHGVDLTSGKTTHTFSYPVYQFSTASSSLGNTEGEYVVSIPSYVPDGEYRIRVWYTGFRLTPIEYAHVVIVDQASYPPILTIIEPHMKKVLRRGERFAVTFRFDATQVEHRMSSESIRIKMHQTGYTDDVICARGDMMGLIPRNTDGVFTRWLTVLDDTPVGSCTLTVIYGAGSQTGHLQEFPENELYDYVEVSTNVLIE